MDWRPRIVEAVTVQQELRETDREGLWEHHLPGVAATPAALDAAEARLGLALDPQHRDFLGHADGWRAFFQTVDLFDAAELGAGPRFRAAQEIVEVLSSVPEALAEAALVGATLVPIAATTEDTDLFVSVAEDGRLRPEVHWFAGGLMDSFADFVEFFDSMVLHNRREIVNLRAGR